MRRLALRSLIALVLIALGAAPASAIPDGLYFSLGIGGATVSGDRGIALNPTSVAGNATIVGLNDQARDELSRDPIIWWNLAAASLALFGLILAVNLVGDAVRDVLDPRTVREEQ